MENFIWAKPTETVMLGGLSMKTGVATVHSVNLLFDSANNRPYIDVYFAEKGTSFNETTDKNGNIVKTPQRGCKLHSSFTSGEKLYQDKKLHMLFGKVNTVIDVSESAKGVFQVLGVDKGFKFDETKQHLKNGSMQLQSETSQLWEYANHKLKSEIEMFHGLMSDMDKVKYPNQADLYKDYDFFFDIKEEKTPESVNHVITFMVYNHSVGLGLAKDVAKQAQQLVGKEVILITKMETNKNGFYGCEIKYILSLSEQDKVEGLLKLINR